MTYTGHHNTSEVVPSIRVVSRSSVLALQAELCAGLVALDLFSTVLSVQSLQPLPLPHSLERISRHPCRRCIFGSSSGEGSAPSSPITSPYQ